MKLCVEVSVLSHPVGFRHLNNSNLQVSLCVGKQSRRHNYGILRILLNIVEVPGVIQDILQIHNRKACLGNSRVAGRNKGAAFRSLRNATCAGNAHRL